MHGGAYSISAQRYAPRRTLRGGICINYSITSVVLLRNQATIRSRCPMGSSRVLCYEVRPSCMQRAMFHIVNCAWLPLIMHALACTSISKEDAKGNIRGRLFPFFPFSKGSTELTRNGNGSNFGEKRRSLHTPFRLS